MKKTSLISFQAKTDSFPYDKNETELHENHPANLETGRIYFSIGSSEIKTTLLRKTPHYSA
ncbi:MAG: hypothetical protein KAZ87_03025 [Spirochaetes bacterium]|nr:hypothetical protein [Spirochaetota bacterium]